MRIRSIGAGLSCAGLLGAMVACSGTDGSSFPHGSAPGSFSGSSSGASYDGGAFGIGPGGTNSPCVSSVAQANLANADLVVMLDRSGSMGDPNEGFSPTLKWTPVTAALESFFMDPNSAGISASLQFFPQGTDLASVCSYAYATPLVALTSTSNPMPLVSAIQATQPAGGTPTLPALQGAVAYAQQVAAAHTLDKTVVVLATDGDPGFGINGQFEEGCTNNDIPHVAAVAQAAFAGKPSIPTYVIGVGPDLQNLDAIAAAGGTGQAVMVPVNDPTQTGQTFQAALNTIRSASLPCQFSIPPAPAGQVINPYAINVILVNAKGTQSVLTYSGDCSNTSGWHYDNPMTPTSVLLCSGACSSARGDAGGKVTLAFGCDTSGLSH
ncbi:MAG TPA: vWA domain-containing protein [Polyangiaceae bacterium]